MCCIAFVSLPHYSRWLSGSSLNEPGSTGITQSAGTVVVSERNIPHVQERIYTLLGRVPANMNSVHIERLVTVTLQIDTHQSATGGKGRGPVTARERMARPGHPCPHPHSSSEYFAREPNALSTGYFSAFLASLARAAAARSMPAESAISSR